MRVLSADGFACVTMQWKRIMQLMIGSNKSDRFIIKYRLCLVSRFRCRDRIKNKHPLQRVDSLNGCKVGITTIFQRLRRISVLTDWRFQKKKYLCSKLENVFSFIVRMN